MLRLRFPRLHVAAIGGVHCEKAGSLLLADSSSIATMGFLEVLPAIKKWISIWDIARRWVLHHRPDVVLCVDNPGFNMRFARFCNKQNIPVVYLAPPQVWAWGRKRAPRLAKIADLILTFFPWEGKYFTSFGGNVQWVGHPATQLVPLSRYPHTASHHSTVVLFPGSREREVKTFLPVVGKGMKNVMASRKDLRVVVVWASSTLRESFEDEARQWGFSSVEHEAIYDVLHHGSLCITCSGSVTLEVALAGIPQIIVYRVSPLTFWFVCRVYHGSYIGLPNIVAGRCVSPELVQHDFNPEKVEHYVKTLLANPLLKEEAKNTASSLRRKLSNGNAFEIASRAIARYLVS